MSGLRSLTRHQIYGMTSKELYSMMSTSELLSYATFMSTIDLVANGKHRYGNNNIAHLRECDARLEMIDDFYDVSGSSNPSPYSFGKQTLPFGARYLMGKARSSLKETRDKLASSTHNYDETDDDYLYANSNPRPQYQHQKSTTDVVPNQSVKSESSPPIQPVLSQPEISNVKYDQNYPSLPAPKHHDPPVAKQKEPTKSKPVPKNKPPPKSNPVSVPYQPKSNTLGDFIAVKKQKRKTQIK